MKFTKNDLGPSRNMLKVLGKGEWKLDGMEILAFAEMMKWFAGLAKGIEMELMAEEAAEKAKAEEQAKLNSGILVAKPVEDLVKPVDAPKVSKKQKG